MYKITYNDKTGMWEPESITKIEAQNAHYQTFDTLISAAEAVESFNKGDTVVCRDCGETFCITVEEKKWYAEKGYKLPKRCSECRFKRRQAAKEKAEADKAAE